MVLVVASGSMTKVETLEHQNPTSFYLRGPVRKGVPTASPIVIPAQAGIQQLAPRPIPPS